MQQSVFISSKFSPSLDSISVELLRAQDRHQTQLLLTHGKNPDWDVFLDVFLAQTWSLFRAIQ